MATPVKRTQRGRAKSAARTPQTRKTGKLTKPVARWKQTPTQRLLILENAFYRVELWPEQGGAITSYVHKGADLDIIWRNPLLQPARRHVLDQPIAGGSDLYDIMDGCWYISAPNGFFAGDYFGAPLGTHGEIRAVPWEVEILRHTKQELVVVLRGASIRTPFVYRRELTVKADSPLMDWRETMENRCAEPLPVAWLQHPTFGGPLIDGARLITPAKTVAVFKADNPAALQLQAGYTGRWPFVPEREGGAMRDCSLVAAPGSRRDHSVQLTDFDAGWGCIWNAERKLGFSMQWDLDVYPYAWSWNCGGGHRHYPLWGQGHIMTLQPSTSPVGRFPDLLRDGKLCTIPAQGEVTAMMRTGFVTTPEGPWA